MERILSLLCLNIDSELVALASRRISHICLFILALNQIKVGSPLVSVKVLVEEFASVSKLAPTILVELALKGRILGVMKIFRQGCAKVRMRWINFKGTPILDPSNHGGIFEIHFGHQVVDGQGKVAALGF